MNDIKTENSMLKSKMINSHQNAPEEHDAKHNTTFCHKMHVQITIPTIPTVFNNNICDMSMYVL